MHALDQLLVLALGVVQRASDSEQIPEMSEAPVPTDATATDTFSSQPLGAKNVHLS